MKKNAEACRSDRVLIAWDRNAVVAIRGDGPDNPERPRRMERKRGPSDFRPRASKNKR
jgi:hypothetical protein